jgi:hypothetical protein
MGRHVSNFTHQHVVAQFDWDVVIADYVVIAS